jgi:DNA-binding transcriptional ArsR family regulator
VCALVTDRPVVVSGMENHAEEDAARRGVAYRVVVERDVVTAANGMTELAAALGRNEQVRVVDRVPTKLVVADRATALVPLTRRLAEPAALVVHASGLLESLMGLFEGVWRQAMPLRLEGADVLIEETPEQPDGTDLQILSLLLAGLTDASVAKQLDLGLRTVQRRVKRLMEIAGVTTRLQLGWQAYERGWVTRGLL